MGWLKKTAAGLAVAGVAGYASLLHYVVPSYFEHTLPAIQNVASDMIYGDITIASLSWNGGRTLHLGEITVRDDKGDEVARIAQVEVELDPIKAALSKKPEKAISKIHLQDPVMYLVMNKENKWNVTKVMKPSDSKENPFYGLIEISNGALEISTPYGRWNLDVDGTADAGGNPNYALDLQAGLKDERVKVTGLVDAEGNGQLDIKSDKLSTNDFATVAEKLGNVKDLQGGIKDLAVRYTRHGESIAVSGEGTVDNLQGSVDYKDRTITVGAKGKVGFEDTSVHPKSLQVQVNGDPYELDGRINLAKLAEPSASDFRITLKGTNLENLVPEGQLKGLVKGEVVLNGDLSSINAKGQLESKTLTTGATTLQEVVIPLDIVDSKLAINNGGCRLDSGSTRFDVYYDMKKGDLTGAVDLVQATTHIVQDGVVIPVSADGAVALKGLVTEKESRVNMAAHLSSADYKRLALKNIAADADFDGSRLTVNSLSGFTANGGALNTKGTYDTATQAFAFTGGLSNFPLNSVVPADANNDYGLLSAAFSVAGDESNVNYSGQTQLGQAKLSGVPVTSLEGNIAVQDKLVTLENLRGVIGDQGETVVNGTVDISGTEPVLNLTASSSNVRIEDMLKGAASSIAVTGALNGTVAVKGPLSQPDVIGKHSLTNGSIKGQLFDSLAADYAYVDGAATIKDAKLLTMASEVNLKGTMTKDQRLDFNIQANNVLLKNLPLSGENFDVDGRVTALGHVTGTMTRPRFDGSVNSDSIAINGQQIDDVDGYLSSDGGIKNNLRVHFTQAMGGDYKARLSYDKNENLFKGAIAVQDGNLGTIMAYLKQDISVEGALDGTVTINEHDPKEGVIVKGIVKDASFGELIYDELALDLLYKDDLLTLNKFKAHEDDGGGAEVTGSYNTASKEMHLYLKAEEADPAIFTAFMHDPLPLKGNMSGEAKLDGNLNTLKGFGRLSIDKGSFAGQGFDKALINLTVAEDNIRLEEISVAKDIYRLLAVGDIPVDLLRDYNNRYNNGAEMDVHVRFENGDLAMLPIFSKSVEWGQGPLTGEVLISGTLQDPHMRGSLNVDKGTVKLADMQNMLENVTLNVDFKDKRIELENSGFEIGKGKVGLEGVFDLVGAEDRTYYIKLALDNAQPQSELFTGRLNGVIEVLPEAFRETIPPDTALVSGFRPKVKGELRIDDAMINMPLVPALGEGQSNIGLDFKVTLGPKIHLYNKYLYDMWLAGGLNLQGSTLHPAIDGEIKVDHGTFSYLRTPFTIERAVASFPDKDSFMPAISLSADADYNRYKVHVKASGPVLDLKMQLTSDPPLSEKSLLRMLTLKRYDVDNEDSTVGDQDAHSLIATGLEMTVLGDVEDVMKQALGLSNMRFYAGKMQSGRGLMAGHTASKDEQEQYNIEATKAITKNLQFGYGKSVNSDSSAYFAQYRLNRWQLMYSDENKRRGNDNFIGVEYRMSFK